MSHVKDKPFWLCGNCGHPAIRHRVQMHDDGDIGGRWETTFCNDEDVMDDGIFRDTEVCGCSNYVPVDNLDQITKTHDMKEAKRVSNNPRNKVRKGRRHSESTHLRDPKAKA